MPFLSKHVKDIMNPKSQGLCFTSHSELNPSFCFSNPFNQLSIEKEEKVLKDGCRPGVKRNDFNSHSGTLEGASNIPSFLHPSSRVT